MALSKPLPEEVWRGLQGYCISCGFLGKRSLYQDVVYEANDHDRTNFSFVSYRHPTATHTQTLPHCFVNYLPLSKEFRDLEKKYQRTKDNSEISYEITTRDIKCPKWTPYKDFQTPKEHYEEFKMWELEQRRKEFEQKMENDRKEFELKLDEANRQERKRTDRIMIWLTIAAIIFALAEVAAGTMGITDDSWILRFFREFVIR